MKRIRLLILATSLVLIAAAAPVKMPSAERKARSFVAENHGIFKNADVALAYTATNGQSKDYALFYVYNVGNDNGFVIITGDDRAVPVLGYSDKGQFSMDNIPDNLRMWLDYYTEAMLHVVSQDIQGVAPQTRPTDVIKPLLTTTWDQGWPYNLLCPSSGNKQCPTGCVATAMAQVMNYHQFPIEETTEIPAYYCRSLSQNLPALPPVTFEWDMMEDTYNWQSTEESQMAVAKLMQYCGQAVQMEYSASSSGAQTFDLGWRMSNYFKFPSTMHYVYHEGYSIAEWDSLLIHELKTNGPILYTGYTTAWEGHAFVCDGYDGNGLYHINWGWGGSADGYYRISVLDASESGTGGSSTSLRFTINQAALLGLKTSGEDDYVSPEQSIVFSSRPSLGFGREYSRKEMGVSFPAVKIAGSFNAVAEAGYYGTGFALYDEEGEMVKVLSKRNDYFWPGYGVDASYHINGMGADIVSGHFTIRPVYQDKNGEWVLAKGAERHYVDMVVDSLEMTLTPVPKADFVVNSIRHSGKTLTVNITNNDEEFNGPIYVRKLMDNGSEEDIAYEMVAIEPNSTRNISIYIGDDVSLNLERDVIYLSVDEYKGLYFYCNVYNTDADLSCNVDVFNVTNDSSTIVGDKVMCEMKVTNNGTGAYRHFVTLSLQGADGLRSNGFRKLFELGAGESDTVEIELPLDDYEGIKTLVGTNYVGNEEKTMWESKNYEVSPGAIYWNDKGMVRVCIAADILTVPEDALTVYVGNSYTSDVIPNSNPNTIYLLDKTIPPSLYGHNVVNSEMKTGKISLTDGYGYFFPKELNATSSVSYSRTFTEDGVGKWSTVSLPFATNKILVDGKTVNWSHDDDDQDKSLWIMSVSAVEGDMVTLQYTDKMQANQPYLIAVSEDLAGKTLDFIGGKTKFTPTQDSPSHLLVDGYTFTGVNVASDMPKVFVIEDDEFVYGEETRQVAPFRAYLSVEGTPAYSRLYISGQDITNGVVSILAAEGGDMPAVYDMQGRRVHVHDTLNGLPKGVYIVGGKKRIVK